MEILGVGLEESAGKYNLAGNESLTANRRANETRMSDYAYNFNFVDSLKKSDNATLEE
jgi:hypothetical protein